jgi:fucose permease
MASVFPTLLAFAGRHMAMSGAISRWFFVGSGLGGMILPWLLGTLIDRIGATAMIPALMLDLGLSFFAFTGAKIAATKQNNQVKS